MLAWFAAASALAIGQPAPQEAPDADPVAELGTVQVDGRPLAEQARSFVATATEGARGRALARWEGPVCFGVANLKADVAQALIDRMAEVAVSLGIETQRPGCKPNLLVVVARADDAEAVVRRAIDRSEFDFRPARQGTDRGSAALKAFADSTAPVRWWHVSLPTEIRTGRQAMLLDGEPLAAPGIGSSRPMLSIRVDSLSRTSSTVRNDLMRVIIVVDADQAAAAPFPALADYLAMVGLAQIDPEADVGGAPTILNLFNPAATQPTQRMTDWDAAFLVSLYEARSNPSSLNHHEHDMGRRLARVLERERPAAN